MTLPTISHQRALATKRNYKKNRMLHCYWLNTEKNSGGKFERKSWKFYLRLACILIYHAVYLPCLRSVVILPATTGAFTVSESSWRSPLHGVRKLGTRPGTTENPLRPTYLVNFKPQVSAWN